MLTVPPSASPVHTGRFDLTALSPFVSAGSVEPESAPRVDLAGPWLLGHAFGAHGEPPRLPAEYDADQAEAFREGWQAGDAGRRLTRGWPRELAADDLGAWLADRHGADHDQQADPFDVESWSIPEAEWREVSIGFVRDPEELIDDAERCRVLGHRA